MPVEKLRKHQEAVLSRYEEFDDESKVYDFASRKMMPFEVSIDQSLMKDDSPPGWYKWTRKGWTWQPTEIDPQDDTVKAHLRAWVAKMGWCEGDALMVLGMA